MKPFRFGVNVGRARSRAEWADKARKIESLGYDILTVPDHLADFLAPIPALVSAAEATKNLRNTVGSGSDRAQRGCALAGPLGDTRGLVQQTISFFLANGNSCRHQRDREGVRR